MDDRTLGWSPCANSGRAVRFAGTGPRRPEAVAGLPQVASVIAAGWVEVDAATGGSAMPCGLEFPAARAKLNVGDCDPDVRLAAPSNW
ncbi:MAG: hypothetical protein U0790_28000 [Isosphaeraceae bacterium]